MKSKISAILLSSGTETMTANSLAIEYAERKKQKAGSGKQQEEEHNASSYCRLSSDGDWSVLLLSIHHGTV